jgi:hypothetical protein
MTPLELYVRHPETTDNNIGILRGYSYNHIPEMDDGISLPWKDPNCRIEIRYYSDQCPDGRRIWRLASVWFLDSNNEWLPFMIVQNAGREGDDYSDRFITAPDTYDLAIKYLASLVEPDEAQETDIVDPAQDIETLDNFYGARLDGPPYQG